MQQYQTNRRTKLGKFNIIVYYAKMAANKKYVHKIHTKYRNKKAEMHDKIID